MLIDTLGEADYLPRGRSFRNGKRFGNRLMLLTLSLILVFGVFTACKKEPAKPSSGTETPAAKPEQPKAAEPGPAQPKAEEPKKLTKVFVGQSVESLTNAPMYVAKSKGFFREMGYDVEYVTLGAGPAFQVAMAGNVPIVQLGSNFILSAEKAGIAPGEVFYAASLVNRMTMDMVFRKEIVQKLGLKRSMPIQERYRALKGLKIGISYAGAATEYYTKFFAKLGGLDPDKDMTMVAIGGAGAQVAALASGQIDAYQWTAPTPQQSVVQGDGEIIISSAEGDVPELANIPYTGIIINKKWAEKNPDVVKAVLTGVAKGANFILDNFEEAKDILHQDYFKNMDKEVFSKAMDSLKTSYPRNAMTTAEGMKQLSRVMVETGEIKQEFDASEGVWWSNKYLEGLK